MPYVLAISHEYGTDVFLFHRKESAEKRLLDRNAASLWGVEDNDSNYLREVAEEMIPEAVDAGRATLAKLGV